jgi:hypothetical protein
MAATATQTSRSSREQATPWVRRNPAYIADGEFNQACKRWDLSHAAQDVLRVLIFQFDLVKGQAHKGPTQDVKARFRTLNQAFPWPVTLVHRFSWERPAEGEDQGLSGFRRNGARENGWSSPRRRSPSSVEVAKEGIESISGPAATGPLTNNQKTLYMV